MTSLKKTYLLGSVLLFLLALAGCQGSARSATLEQQRHPVDGLSGVLVGNLGGAIDQPYSLCPPPIRREYSVDR